MIDTSITQGIVFFLYIALMVGMGFVFYSRSKSHSDYILGGRGMNVWVTALSAQASDMSGWLLIGLPGLAYATTLGATEAIWTAIGLAIGTYINWLIVAKPLRKYTEIAGNSLTIPEFLQNRFHDKTNLLRIIPAIFILIFFLIYTASGFVSGAKLFNLVFHIPYTTALIISVLVIVAYTFLGGFKAVCWTDLFQGIMMFFAVIIVPIVMITRLNTNVGFSMSEIPKINLFPDGSANAFGWMSIIGAIAWGLGYFGQPHILVRFMAIRSPKEVRPARIIAMIWVLFSLAAAVAVGFFGKPYLASIGMPLAEGAQETVFMVLVSHIFPTVIAAVLLSAILAAIMSTADSQLLVTASAVSGDFYKTFVNKKADDKELVWVSRITVVIVAIIAGLFAADPNSSVFEIVSHAWAGFGAAFGPIILCSLFWKRCNGKGAIAGVISGGTVALLWAYLPNIMGWFGVTSLPGIFSLYEIVPGFLVSLIAIFTVSLATKAPEDSIIKEFESVKTVNL
jgi:sodium/proline symporter